MGGVGLGVVEKCRSWDVSIYGLDNSPGWLVHQMLRAGLEEGSCGTDHSLIDGHVVDWIGFVYTCTRYINGIANGHAVSVGCGRSV